MRKKMTIAFAAFLLILSMSGCGSAAKNSAAYAAAESAPAAAAGDMAYPEPEEYGYEDAASMSGQSKAPSDHAKLIYTADIGLETTEFDDVSGKLTGLVSELGGYFEASSVDNYGGYRHGSYTVRVPSENFEAMCSRAGEMCLLTSISRYAEDVSESYYDTESRLVTQQTKLERLQELLSRAENMEDIITIESAISDTELQIENLTGTLRRYDSLVGFSTVNISLDEVYRLSNVEEPAIGFGAKLGAALKRGGESFVTGVQALLIFIAANWAVLLIIAAAVCAGIFVNKKRRAKRTGQDAAGKNK